MDCLIYSSIYLHVDIVNIIMMFICIENMKTFLLKYKIDPKIFFGIIKKHNMMIMGSFPLTCLLNQHVHPKSDIDIMFHNMELEVGLFNRGCMSQRLRMTIDEINKHRSRPLEKVNLCGYAQYVNIIPQIYECTTYILADEYNEQCRIEGSNIDRTKRPRIKRPELRIQFVELECDPVDFMNDNFDFPLGKMYFDGADLTITNYLGCVFNKRIYIDSINITQIISYGDPRIVEQLKPLKIFIECNKKLILDKNISCLKEIIINITNTNKQLITVFVEYLEKVLAIPFSLQFSNRRTSMLVEKQVFQLRRQ